MPNKVYVTQETRKVFKASGGDVLFTPTTLANAAGRLSDRADLGALPRSGWYRWYAETQLQATPTVGAVLRVYLSHWDNDTGPADQDGDVGAADAAFATENDLRNLKHIGNVIVDAATASVVFAASGLVYIPVRYVSLVWWNQTGAALTATAADHFFALTPVPDEIQ